MTLTPDFPPSTGGIQTLFDRTLAHLDAWDHHVVTRGPGARALGDIPVNRTRIRTSRAALLELNLRSVAAAIKGRPDVVLAGHVNLAPAAIVIRALGVAPVVAVLHADEIGAFTKMSRALLGSATAAWAVSRFTRDLALQVAPRSCGITVVHPGVDPDDTGSVPPRRAARPTIVTVSRLVERYKGHDVTLDAVALVKREVPDVRWLVVGDGPLRPELEAKAARLGLLHSTVEFLGRVDDVVRDRLLRESHLFAMLSRLRDGAPGGEGFGIVYLEAARVGLPSVAGDCGGAIDAVVHGESGLRVDPTNPRAVADALTAVLTDDELRGELSVGARRHAAAHTWAHTANGVDRLLRSVQRT